MKSHERLREEYEDALFALLMEGLEETENDEALRLSEELNRDPSAEVPEAARKRCEHLIRTAYAQRQLRTTGRTAARWLTKAAVVAALTGAMFTAAFALSEDVRAAALNTLIQVMDDRTEIKFQQTQANPNQTPPETIAGLDYHYNIALEWVPEGYDLISGWTVEDGPSDHAVYMNSQESEIVIDVKPYHPNAIYTFDTENTVSKEIEIQNRTSTLYAKDANALEQIQLNMPQIWSDLTVFWIDDASQVIYCVSATNQTEAEMIRLANGVHWGG